MRASALTTLAAAAVGLKDGQVFRKMGFQETMMHTTMEKSGSLCYSVLSYSLIVDCQRRLEERHVQMALEALRKQIPILRARVEKREDGNYMVASNAKTDLTVLPAGGDWLKHHEDRSSNLTLYNTPNGPHWRAAMMNQPQNTTAPTKSPHRAVLYLTIPHTFTDGISQGLMLGQLLRNLDEVVSHEKVEERPPVPVYPCVEDVLEKQKFTVPVIWTLVKAVCLAIRHRNSPFLKGYVSEYNPDRSKDTPCRMAATTMPAEDIAKLRVKCKKRGLTVNAALSAAVNVAGARMTEHTPDGTHNPGPYTMRFIFLVNLRRFYPPEIDRKQLYDTTVGGGASQVQVPSTSIEHFWSVAQDVHDSLNRQLKLRMPIISTQRIMPLLFKPDKYDLETEVAKNAKRNFSPSDYTINNLGSLDAMFPRTTAVVPVEVHRTFRQHPGMDHSFGAHMFQTAGGRLCYDLNYNHGRVKREHAERFQAIVVDVLKEVANQAE